MSENEDYLGIIDDMLEDRNEWEQAPEVVYLAVRAMLRYLVTQQETFEQHKMLINQQSLQLKEIIFGTKAWRKETVQEIEQKVEQCFRGLQFKEREKLRVGETDQYSALDESSDYEKLLSKGGNQVLAGLDSTALEEVKAVVGVMLQKRMFVMNNEFNDKVKSINLQLAVIQQNFEQRILDTNTTLAQKCRSTEEQVQLLIKRNDRLEQLNNYKAESVLPNEIIDKFSILETNYRRSNDNVVKMIDMIHSDYVDRHELQQLLKELQSKEEGKATKKKADKKITKEEDAIDSTEKALKMLRSEMNQQFGQLKLRILAETSQVVKIDAIQRIVNNVQKQLMLKQNDLQTDINHLAARIGQIGRVAEEDGKQPLYCADRKVRLPTQVMKQINVSLSKIEKTLNDKSVVEFRKLQQHIESKLASQKQELLTELQRREKLLCELISETCGNKDIVPAPSAEQNQLSNPLLILFQNNILCHYVYFGEQNCKKDALIIWEKEAVNSMIDNFSWKKGTAVITINAAGVYRIEAALYCGIDGEAYLLLNGEPIAVFSKQFGEKVTCLKSRGSVFSEPVLLPAKAKVSVRVNCAFFGQAYLRIHKV